MSFIPRYHEWSSEAILRDSKVSNSPEALELRTIRRPYFFHDMSSEYDSKHLAKYLAESDIDLSDEFWNMCEVWLRDEQNHYVGLRRINNLLYGEAVENIANRVTSREPNFEPIQHLIEDEFKILVSIAFDEITSARAYAYDRNAYETLGGKTFLKWVKYAGRDEGCHANNALSLLAHSYGNRLNEVHEHVEKICQYDLTGNVDYHGTFLFDHDTDDFSNDLLKESAKTLCSYFGQGDEFSKLIENLELN